MARIPYGVGVIITKNTLIDQFTGDRIRMEIVKNNDQQKEFCENLT